MEYVESAIEHIEQSVEKADRKLDMIAWQIDAFEKEFCDPENEIPVFRLLRSMNQITKDYQNVHQEILELQALQKQLNHSLKTELKLIQKHFNLLRDKIVGHKSPQLK
ncbi:hypothetical protein HN011_012333 [Eciton burchellii]|nr:hypothetical protein HN011_012333 [Eciton burchellii]